MSKIRILPEQLANQIAAGEVIERPASVVKEFLENAVDAGARHIAVHVEGGGGRLLRIIDDGCGMDQDDILLSLERHATSKIATEADLAAIHTLGFRGEAIPSIASVSLLTITSRPPAAPLGTRVEVRYGRVEKVHEMGCAHGTVMEVRNLFGNVPVRRKFLKSTQTELFHIEEVVRNYAVLCHGLAMSYYVDGREIFSLQPMPESWETRVKGVLGRKARAGLIKVGPAPESGEHQGLAIAGFLVPPAESQGTGLGLRLFVNERLVRDRLIGHAVAEGLQNYLMKGQRPAGVLSLILAPEAVDVNVHPTKQEIRFHKPNVIHQLVVRRVREAIQTYQDQVKHTLFARAGEANGSPAPVETKPPSHEPLAAQPAWRQPELPRGMESRDRSWLARSDRSPANEVCEPRPVVAPQAPVRAESSPVPGTGSEPGNLGRLRPIGQLLNAYILCESDEGLVAIDQHAAQERIIFEALKEEYTGKGIARQQLLFPAMIECAAAEIEAVTQHGQELARLGLEIAEFGGQSLVIKAVPAVMARVPPEEIVRGILEQVSGGEGGGPMARRFESILAGMACKAALKAGQPLAPVEIDSLLGKMHDTKEFLHCPHGRPVLKCFSSNEIKKWFQRT